MAKVKTGALVTDIRGSIGGSVFARNGGGAYMRNKVTPLNPRSVEQSRVRNIFAQLSQGWSQLTESQRVAWNNAVGNYAQTDIFGDNQTLSGKALYQQLNQNNLLVGRTAITSPPVNQEVRTVSDFDPIYNTTTPALDIGGASAGMGTQILIYATPAVTAGTTFVKNKLRLIGTEQLVGSSVDVLTKYEDRFGAISENDRIAVAIRVIAPDGQAGALQTKFVKYE